MMFSTPDRVEAERLSQISHRYLVAIYISVANKMSDILEECRHSDMHRALLTRLDGAQLNLREPFCLDPGMRREIPVVSLCKSIA
jgi:hypothetical protein